MPLPQRDLEIVVSAGFGIALDLGSRMRGLATLAKALNEGDYALAKGELVKFNPYHLGPGRAIHHGGV
ncbi:MAG: hypothetical protein WCC90_19575 [Methylocella sp.]